MMYKPTYIQTLFNNKTYLYWILEHMTFKSEPKQFGCILKILNLQLRNFWEDGYGFIYLDCLTKEYKQKLP